MKSPRTKLLVLATLAVAVCCSMGKHAQAGNESNRDEVRKNVSGGGWNVVWGVNINEAEYVKAAASLYSGSFAAYFENYLQRTIDKVAKDSPDVTKKGLKEAVERLFRGKGGETRIGRLGVKAGIATYRRWYVTKVKVPDGTEKYKIKGPFGSWTWGYRAKFKTIENKTSLPNHHQPFVAFRLP